ncbi:alpha-(1,3)-fucosyltransferase 7-like [Montipora foliosa]|uniref:alpha-(1,3)-fucosyltransferase 7-like n=1 Tax=Montipora foliosa TaxID=591990 RepID=UPI0035F1B37D
MNTAQRCFLTLIAATGFIMLFTIGSHFMSDVNFVEFTNQFRMNSSATELKGRSQSVDLGTENNFTREMTVILVYTSFFGDTNWVKKGGRCVWYQPEERQCRMDLFEITLNKTRFAESSIVIFHARDMPAVSELKSLLKSRPTSQRWVYAVWESPIATPNPSALNGLFNLTWTYRTDSDFWAPYGYYEPYRQEDGKMDEVATMTDYTEGKSELVAWMVSNCSPQLRLSFVRELKKFIKVDVYGSCSRIFGQSQACSREKASDCVRKYKFYLSFESALCEDYITEKYWGNLGDGNVVPVVMGGADYIKLAIPGSYINVMDFKTVKQLAEYLQYLDKNNTAYNEYFTWRLKYKVYQDLLSFCAVCRHFYPDNLPETKVYQDLTEYWSQKGKCTQKEQFVTNMLNN